MWVIYQHYNIITKKSYIGLTCQFPLEERWGKNGYNYFYKKETKFSRAIKKYGWDNFKHNILEKNITSFEKAAEREQYWISYFDSYNYGYNMTSGGETTDHFKRPVVQIDKDTLLAIKIFDSAKEAERELNCQNIHKTLYNYKSCCSSCGYYWCFLSEYQNGWLSPKKRSYCIYKIDITSLSILEKYSSVLSASKESGINLYILYQHVRNHYILNGYGYIRQEEYSNIDSIKFLKRPTQQKEIYCLETNKIYPSIKNASKELGICEVSIGRCCQKKSNHAGGKHFCLAIEKEQYIIPENKSFQKIMCCETGIIYNSIKEASLATNISYQIICKNVNNRLKSAKGIHFVKYNKEN